jgi:hypothetical protein
MRSGHRRPKRIGGLLIVPAIHERTDLYAVGMQRF